MDMFQTANYYEVEKNFEKGNFLLPDSMLSLAQQQHVKPLRHDDRSWTSPHQEQRSITSTPHQYLRESIIIMERVN